MVVLQMKNAEANMKEQEKTLLIAQEISFAKTLACNEKRLRDRALRKLRKWLLNRTQAGQTEVLAKNDMMTLWKGLFYCMWMSDKPLIQEELAENISGLVHSLEQTAAFKSFVEAFFLTMREDWSSIDNYRLNKFQMFVRRMLRQILFRCSQDDWALASDLGDIIWSTILLGNLQRPAPLGLGIHFCEIFLQEVAKVSGKKGISQEALTSLLRPFGKCLSNNLADARLRTTVASAIFGDLIQQSDEGIAHQEKLDAWRRMGCPAIPLDQLERVECSDDEETESKEEVEDDVEDEEKEELLDPRAGQLDVELPQIPFDPSQVAAMLHEFINDPSTNQKAKRRLRFVAKKFEDLAKGKYPLEFKLPIPEDEEDAIIRKSKKVVAHSVKHLNNFEKELLEEEIKLGVAKPSVLKRHAQQQLNGPPAKKQKRQSISPRRSNVMSWEVTEVKESENISTNGTNSVSSSPGSQWEVSPSNAASGSKKKANDWEQPLQDGEYEYFVAPRKKKTESTKKKLKKNKKEQKKGQSQASPEAQTEAKQNGLKESCAHVTPTQHVVLPSPAQRRRDSVTITPITTPVTSRIIMTSENLSTSLTVSGRKKVEFHLNRNMFQEVREYAEQLKNSPGIPHDPNKRPTQGLLKPATPTSVQSPLFKRRMRIIM